MILCLPEGIFGGLSSRLAGLGIGRRETDLAIVGARLAAALRHAIGLHVPLLVFRDVTRISKDRADDRET